MSCCSVNLSKFENTWIKIKCCQNCCQSQSKVLSKTQSVSGLMNTQNFKSAVIFKNCTQNTKNSLNSLIVCPTEKIFLDVNIMTNTKITYSQQGDYLLPDLKLPQQSKCEIGVFGLRHKNYLLRYHKIRYYNLLTSGKLVEYLSDIDNQANELFTTLIKQLSEKENVTEQLKAENQAEWIRRMNSIRNRALEIVNKELIYK